DADDDAGELRPLIPYDGSGQARAGRPHERNGSRLVTDHFDELSIQKISLPDVPVADHPAARELVPARGKRGELDAALISNRNVANDFESLPRVDVVHDRLHEHRRFFVPPSDVVAD